MQSSLVLETRRRCLSADAQEVRLFQNYPKTMLIKEDNMKRLLFVAVLLVLLFGVSALAQPSRRDGRDRWAEMRRLAAADHRH